MSKASQRREAERRKRFQEQGAPRWMAEDIIRTKGEYLRTVQPQAYWVLVGELGKPDRKKSKEWSSSQFAGVMKNLRQMDMMRDGSGIGNERLSQRSDVLRLLPCMIFVSSEGLEDHAWCIPHSIMAYKDRPEDFLKAAHQKIIGWGSRVGATNPRGLLCIEIGGDGGGQLMTLISANGEYETRMMVHEVSGYEELIMRSTVGAVGFAMRERISLGSMELDATSAGWKEASEGMSTEEVIEAAAMPYCGVISDLTRSFTWMTSSLEKVLKEALSGSVEALERALKVDAGQLGGPGQSRQGRGTAGGQVAQAGVDDAGGELGKLLDQVRRSRTELQEAQEQLAQERSARVELEGLRRLEAEERARKRVGVRKAVSMLAGVRSVEDRI